MGEALL